MFIVSHIIYNNIFVYLPLDENYALINKKTNDNYKRIRNEAVIKIQRTYKLNNVPYNYIFDNRDIIKNPTKYIRYYIKYYPLDHLDKTIDLFSRKLRRDDLIINKSSPYSFRDFKNVLNKCSISDISYVGW